MPKTKWLHNAESSQSPDSTDLQAPAAVVKQPDTPQIQINLDGAGPPGADLSVPGLPDGTSIHEETIQAGKFDATGIDDILSMSMSTGEHLSVALEPKGGSRFSGEIEVRDGNGLVLASAKASEAGAPVYLQQLEITPTGSYEIRLRSLYGVGAYTAQAVANAQIETADANNVGLASALDIDGSAAAQEDGSKRLAVVARTGTADTADGAIPPDYFRFRLEPGDQVGLVLGAEAGSWRLELLDADGTMLAAAEGDPAGSDLEVPVIEAPSSGLYYARVSSSSANCAYRLEITRKPETSVEPISQNAAYGLLAAETNPAPEAQLFSASAPSTETEPNDTISTATGLTLAEDPSLSGLWLGFGIGNLTYSKPGDYYGDPDYWRVELKAGDWLTVAAASPSGAIHLNLDVLNTSGQWLAGDSNWGDKPLVSHYQVPSDGIYYLRLYKYHNDSSSAATYDLNVEVARGIQQENDSRYSYYSNNFLSNANPLNLSASGNQHLRATMEGTLAPQSDNTTDKDYFALGEFNARNTIELNLRLSSDGVFQPWLTLRDANDRIIPDEDGNPWDGHVEATLTADGPYYARLESTWAYGGHTYLLLDANGTWTAAQAQAQLAGGSLVKVDDAPEQTFLTASFGTLGSGFWIGASDAATEGVWRWTDGRAVGYSNWGTGQPSRAASDYDFAYMDAGGRWYDNSDCIVRYGWSSWGTSIYKGIAEIDSAQTSGQMSPGKRDRYLLDVDITDSIAPRVLAVTGLPTAGKTLDAPLDLNGSGIGVTLTESVDAADPLRVWDLRGAGADGIFDTADDVLRQISPASPYDGGTTVKLKLNDGGGWLDAGLYRFTAALRDRSGNPLDGDGNGVGGDSYLQFFRVSYSRTYIFEGEPYANTTLPLMEDPAGSGLWLARGLGGFSGELQDIWQVDLKAGDWLTVAFDVTSGEYWRHPDLFVGNDAGDYWPTSGAGEGSARLSHVQIPSDGTYYVGVLYWTDSAAGYELNLTVARDIQQEAEDYYQSNGTTASANPLTLAVEGNHRASAVQGTLSYYRDEDFFSMGTVNAGESIFLGTKTPSGSPLNPIVEIWSSSKAVSLASSDPSTAVARFDVTTTGEYFARVQSNSNTGKIGQPYVLNAAVWPTGANSFADLALASVSAPTAALSGGTAGVRWTVGNYGTATTDRDSWTDRVILSPNGVYGDGDDIEIAVVAHSGTLAVGQSYTAETDVRLPVGVARNFNVFIETDHSHQVSEYFFEDNNVGKASTQIQITPAPVANLQVGNVTAPSDGVAGQPSNIAWTVTNIGSVTTGDGTPGSVNTEWTDRIVLSSNAVFGDGDDILVADVLHSGALSPQSAYQGTYTGNLPAGLSGEYHVLVGSDIGNTIFEGVGNETNVAAATGQIDVAQAPYADLRVTNLSGPASCQAGQTVAWQWAVENSLDAWGATPTGAWSDRLILSRDGTYGNGDDQALGTFTHTGTLAPGASDQEGRSVTLLNRPGFLGGSNI